MRAKELLKAYPEAWATVETAVFDDIMGNGGFEHVQLKAKRRVCYNAAFMAVDLIHKHKMMYKRNPNYLNNPLPDSQYWC